MDLYKPVGNVQHSGTFNACLVPVLAGLAFVRAARKPQFYDALESLSTHFHRGLDEIIASRGANMIAPQFGARFNIVMGRKTPASRYEDCFCHESRTMLRFRMLRPSIPGRTMT